MVNGGKEKKKETNQTHMTAPRYSGELIIDKKERHRHFGESRVVMSLSHGREEEQDQWKGGKWNNQKIYITSGGAT